MNAIRFLKHYSWAETHFDIFLGSLVASKWTALGFFAYTLLAMAAGAALF